MTEDSALWATKEDFLERNARAWTIETGRIEGIYDLSRELTEQFIEQGFLASLVGHDNATLPAERLVAHLNDQRRALGLARDAVTQRRPLSHGLLCEWHACIVASQDRAPTRGPKDERGTMPLRKGQYKAWPNNPRTPSGEIHEYCPPIHVRSELDRLFEMHATHRAAGVPTEVEAAGLHHRFVQIHPFQDGNGRMARSLVASTPSDTGRYRSSRPKSGTSTSTPWRRRIGATCARS